MSKHNWKLLFRVPGGHKYFRNAGNQIAIADESGYYPHETDDGVLWLDREASIVVSRSGPADLQIMVPLRDEEGNQQATPVCADEMLMVASYFQMDVVGKHLSRTGYYFKLQGPYECELQCSSPSALSPASVDVSARTTP